MPLRLRSAGGGSVQLNPPVATSTDVVMEVPAYDGAKLLTNKTPGCVLQVVQTVKTTSFTASSAAPTFVDITGLSVTITPISATSKIYVQYSAYLSQTGASGTYQMITRLARNGVGINLGEVRGSNTQATAGGGSQSYWYPMSHNCTFLDSPNTTSPITYNVQMCSESGVAGFVGGSSNSGSALGFTAPSQITVMEIAA